MRATGEFQVESFKPATLEPAPEEIPTAFPVGVATMLKRYDGEVSGRSTTVFTAAFDQARGIGTYVAMESFEGSISGVRGSFNFVHAASTSGTDRFDEHFVIVASSGTKDLASIRGGGGMAVDDGGIHRIWFEYELE
jgi:Protein of unknown function (DUF3224)